MNTQIHKSVSLKSRQGFTLIELMVAVAVIGILAAVAYPSYTAYVRRSNRTDATRSVTQTVQTLERCYSQSFTYTSAPCDAWVSTPTFNSPNGFYSITVSTTAASAGVAATYAVTASARNSQLGDTDCRTFVQTNAAQSATNSSGADSTSLCWKN